MKSIFFSIDFFEDEFENLKFFKINNHIYFNINLNPSTYFDEYFYFLKNSGINLLELSSKKNQKQSISFLQKLCKHHDIQITHTEYENDEYYFNYNSISDDVCLLRIHDNHISDFDSVFSKNLLHCLDNISLNFCIDTVNYYDDNDKSKRDKDKSYFILNELDKDYFVPVNYDANLSKNEFMIQSYTKKDNNYHQIIRAYYSITEFESEKTYMPLMIYKLNSNSVDINKSKMDIFIDETNHFYKISDMSIESKNKVEEICNKIIDTYLV